MREMTLTPIARFLRLAKRESAKPARMRQPNKGLFCVCGEKATCKGKCDKCYNRDRYRDSVGGLRFPRITPETQLARVLKRVDQSSLLGCWNWTGPSICPKKYPAYRVPRCRGLDPIDAPKPRSTYPYRLVYQHMVGPIPEGMTVDHICWNPMCCNPAHLQLLTLAENSARKSPEWREKHRARRIRQPQESA